MWFSLFHWSPSDKETSNKKTSSAHKERRAAGWMQANAPHSQHLKGIALKMWKSNQEQTASTGEFFFLLFLIRLWYFPQTEIFWLLVQLPKPHRNVYVTSNASTCNTLFINGGYCCQPKGSCSEIKMAALYLCSWSLSGATEYLLTLLKESNISGWFLFFLSLSVFVLHCLRKRAQLHW